MPLMTNRSDSWWPQHRDGLILAMLARESVNAARTIARGDLAWIVFGGGALAAYGTALLCGALRAHATALEAHPGQVVVGLGVTALLAGVTTGQVTTRLAGRRAWAPFTLALPLAPRDRRRMAAVAAVMLGAVALGMGAGCVMTALSLIGSPHVGVGAVLFGLVFAAGFALPLNIGLRAGEIRPSSEPAACEDGSRRSLPSLGRLDRCRPAWLGAWAWGLQAGRLRLDGWLSAKALVLGVIAALAIGASLARHDAAPASLTGTFGGLAIFMLSLRCRPLASPVLRTGPTSFTRLCLRLALMPFVLSGVYFAVLAGSAVAAEPAAWPMPAQGAVELAMLSGIYAVFALYFMSRPGVAALAFLAAIGDVAYESLEYGRPVYLALALLVVFLWIRARRQHAHG